MSSKTISVLQFSGTWQNLLDNSFDTGCLYGCLVVLYIIAGQGDEYPSISQLQLQLLGDSFGVSDGVG